VQLSAPLILDNPTSKSVIAERVNRDEEWEALKELGIDGGTGIWLAG
jgi:EAL domain-containing protein (putative c-di-GMP-specific phosphodiesterase class I)